MSLAPPPTLQVRNLRTHFFTDDGVVKAVDGVSFPIYKGKTLGVNKGADSGMIKITDKGPLEDGKWPHLTVGKSADLKKGQWVVCLGHPGGWRKDRPPVVSGSRRGRPANRAAIVKTLLTTRRRLGQNGGQSGSSLTGVRTACPSGSVSYLVRSGRWQRWKARTALAAATGVVS